MFLGPLPTIDLNQLSLTADLRTNTEHAGRRAEFRIESLVASGDTNEPWNRTGRVEFNPFVDDSFTSVGGLLSSAAIIDSFDVNADAFQIVFAFNDIGFDGGSAGSGFGQGTDNQLFFDNLDFSSLSSALATHEAPEPANVLLVLIGLGAPLLTQRKRAAVTPVLVA